MRKSTIYFIVFSVIASALNYIIYPLMSRLLSSGEYVDITVALSLFTQISTFLSSIIAITIGISKRETSETKVKIQALQAFLFKAFLVLAAIFLISSPFTTHGIHIPLQFVVPITLMMLFSIPVTIVSGYLNGINAMSKLGLVALISATSQFTVALITASLTHNGFYTMLAMTIAQLITIVILYKVFSTSQLPKISISLKSSRASPRYRTLMVYTAFAAVSVVAVSITQISDLLILQNIHSTNLKFYTDIYVISRIVFFAGMILIWPFLGQINVLSLRENIRPFVKLLSLFAIIGLLAAFALLLGGNTLTQILFASNYDISQIQVIGSLSIAFKVSMLVVTSATLYFIVLHRYMALAIAITTSTLFVLYGVIGSKSISTTDVLVHLNILAGLLAIALTLFILFEASRKK